MVIMAALNIDKDQQIPVWVLNDHLPVKIRVSSVGVRKKLEYVEKHYKVATPSTRYKKGNDKKVERN